MLNAIKIVLRGLGLDSRHLYHALSAASLRAAIREQGLAELVARLRAVARRPGARDAALLRVADLQFSPAAISASRAGVALTLGPTALKLLELLMRASPNPVRRRDIERAIWGEYAPDGESLRVHIHGLRAKVDRPFAVPLIHTVHGIGYRIAAPDLHDLPA